MFGLVALSGCGDEGEGGSSASAGPDPGAGGAIAWELAERPRTLDPLFADTPAEQLVARQIAEPLVENLIGPFSESREMRRSPGLATMRPSDGDRIWSARLRPGVSFQDGSPFDAAAVLANAARWTAQPSLSGLPPGLLADSPRPGLVRFILPAPDPAFDRRLASSRLGIVSPRALTAAGAGSGARAGRPGDRRRRRHRPVRASRARLRPPAAGAQHRVVGGRARPRAGRRSARVQSRRRPPPALRPPLLRRRPGRRGARAPASSRAARRDPLLDGRPCCAERGRWRSSARCAGFPRTFRRRRCRACGGPGCGARPRSKRGGGLPLGWMGGY